MSVPEKNSFYSFSFRIRSPVQSVKIDARGSLDQKLLFNQFKNNAGQFFDRQGFINSFERC